MTETGTSTAILRIKLRASLKLPKRFSDKLDNDEIFRDLVNEFLTSKK